MLRFPKISGNDLVAIGVPVGHAGEYPMPPEMAVQLAAQRTGKRIASVPELVTPVPSDGPPQLARWHLTFEGPTTVQTKSGKRATSEVFVGPEYVGGAPVAISVAALDQPLTTNLNWTPLPSAGETHAAFAARNIIHTTQIQRRSDSPVRVESISAWGN